MLSFTVLSFYHTFYRIFRFRGIDFVVNVCYNESTRG